MLRSSAFITAVLGFLMALGYHNQPIQIVQNEAIRFSNVEVEDKFIAFQEVRIQVFDNLMCDDCSKQLNQNLKNLQALANKNERVKLELIFTPDINNELYSQSAKILTCLNSPEMRWEFHKGLHEKKNELTLGKFAEQISEMKQENLESCINGTQSQLSTENNVRYASEQNITVYPTYLINQYRLTGNQPYENISKIVERLLKEQKSVFDLDAGSATDLEKELENFRNAIE